jgi:hypothetical protein
VSGENLRKFSALKSSGGEISLMESFSTVDSKVTCKVSSSATVFTAWRSGCESLLTENPG